MEPSYTVRLSRRIYYISVALAVSILAAEMIFQIFGKSIFELNPYPCFFNQLTGFYCPGCGGTRSVRQLLKGHILKSVYYNPVVPYAFGMWIVYVFSHTISIITGGKVKSMPFKAAYLYIYIIILFLNFLIKNSILLFFNIRLI